MVQSLLVRFVVAEEAVVEVTILCWVDPDEVATPLVLQQRFDHYFLLFGWELGVLVQILLLDPVEPADILELGVNLALYLLCLQALGLCSSFRPRLARLDGSAVLGLGQPDEVEGVLDQVGLDLQVQRGIESERGREIDLQ